MGIIGRKLKRGPHVIVKIIWEQSGICEPVTRRERGSTKTKHTKSSDNVTWISASSGHQNKTNLVDLFLRPGTYKTRLASSPALKSGVVGVCGLCALE